MEPELPDGLQLRDGRWECDDRRPFCRSECLCGFEYLSPGFRRSIDELNQPLPNFRRGVGLLSVEVDLAAPSGPDGAAITILSWADVHV